MLEIQTGRYEKKPRPERIGKRCWKLVFIRAVGDEDHALTESANGELQRRDLLILLRNLVGREHSRTVFDTVAKIPELTKAEQKTFWNCLAV